MYLETNAKCCQNFVKFNKIELTLMYEATIKDGLAEWDRATPLMKIEIFKHRITLWVSQSYYLDGSKLDERKSHEPYVWEIFCPCINCLNGKRQILDGIQEHLLCDGIKKNYTMWIWHGELTSIQSGSQSEPFDVEMGDRFEDMICDLGQESFQQAHAPVYDTLQTDSKKPLYSGARICWHCCRWF